MTQLSTAELRGLGTKHGAATAERLAPVLTRLAAIDAADLDAMLDEEFAKAMTELDREMRAVGLRKGAVAVVKLAAKGAFTKRLSELRAPMLENVPAAGNA